MEIVKCLVENPSGEGLFSFAGSGFGKISIEKDQPEDRGVKERSSVSKMDLVDGLID